MIPWSDISGFSTFGVRETKFFWGRMGPKKLAPFYLQEIEIILTARSILYTRNISEEMAENESISFHTKGLKKNELPCVCVQDFRRVKS